MRTWIATLITISCSSALAAEPPTWQRAPDARQLEELSALPAVPKANVYEVVPTKIDTAIAWHLGKNNFAAISCENAMFLTGGHFSCEPGMKPVLLRAVFGNGGSGSFLVRFHGTALFVSHGSLGAPVTPRNVPLIINLPSLPAELYAWTAAAM